MPRMSVDELAFELLSSYPEGVDVDHMISRCEAEGLRLDAVSRRYDELQWQAEEIAFRTVETVVPKSVIDLTGLESTRMRIKGQAFWVTVAERSEFGGVEYWLVREPKNEHDSNAVAVYGRGRKLGYVSAARAALLAPLLDSMRAEAFAVTKTGASAEQGTRMWVDIPKVDALRKFVRSYGRHG